MESVRLVVVSLTCVSSAMKRVCFCIGNFCVTYCCSLTASPSNTGSMTQSAGATPPATQTATSSNTPSSSITSTVTSTRTQSPTPSQGWLVPRYARLAPTVEGYNVHAVELLILDTSGVIISACSAANIPSSQAASASVSLAVSGQGTSNACDLAVDSMNNGYMMATPSPVPGLSWCVSASGVDRWTVLCSLPTFPTHTCFSTHSRFSNSLLVYTAGTKCAFPAPPSPHWPS